MNKLDNNKHNKFDINIKDKRSSKNLLNIITQTTRQVRSAMQPNQTGLKNNYLTCYPTDRNNISKNSANTSSSPTNKSSIIIQSKDKSILVKDFNHNNQSNLNISAIKNKTIYLNNLTKNNNKSVFKLKLVKTGFSSVFTNKLKANSPKDSKNYNYSNLNTNRINSTNNIIMNIEKEKNTLNKSKVKINLSNVINKKSKEYKSNTILKSARNLYNNIWDINTINYDIFTFNKDHKINNIDYNYKQNSNKDMDKFSSYYSKLNNNLNSRNTKYNLEIKITSDNINNYYTNKNISNVLHNKNINNISNSYKLYKLPYISHNKFKTIDVSDARLTNKLDIKNIDLNYNDSILRTSKHKIKDDSGIKSHCLLNSKKEKLYINSIKTFKTININNLNKTSNKNINYSKKYVLSSSCRTESDANSLYQTKLNTPNFNLNIKNNLNYYNLNSLDLNQPSQTENNLVKILKDMKIENNENTNKSYYNYNNSLDVLDFKNNYLVNFSTKNNNKKSKPNVFSNNKIINQKGNLDSDLDNSKDDKFSYNQLYNNENLSFSLTDAYSNNYNNEHKKFKNNNNYNLYCYNNSNLLKRRSNNYNNNFKDSFVFNLEAISNVNKTSKRLVTINTLKSLGVNLKRKTAGTSVVSISLQNPNTMKTIYSKQLLNKIDENFIVENLLGKGSFGEVYKVIHKKSKHIYALKIIPKQPIIQNNLIRYLLAEKNISTKLDFPFIAKSFNSFQSKSRLYLLMQYYPHGDFGEYLNKEKRMEENNAKYFICQIILALEHLHVNNIVYRDLKPENILIDSEGNAILTDFGLAKENINKYKNEITNSFCGSYAYLAPEILLKQGHGKAVDWYLLGVLFFELLVGIPPYYSTNK